MIVVDSRAAPSKSADAAADVVAADDARDDDVEARDEAKELKVGLELAFVDAVVGEAALDRGGDSLMRRMDESSALPPADPGIRALLSFL